MTEIGKAKVWSWIASISFWLWMGISLIHYSVSIPKHQTFGYLGSQLFSSIQYIHNGLCPPDSC